MVGVQDVTKIQRVLLFRRGLFAIDQVKKIRGFAQRGIGLQQRSCPGERDENRR